MRNKNKSETILLFLSRHHNIMIVSLIKRNLVSLIFITKRHSSRVTFTVPEELCQCFCGHYLLFFLQKYDILLMFCDKAFAFVLESRLSIFFTVLSFSLDINFVSICVNWVKGFQKNIIGIKIHFCLLGEGICGQ